MDPEFIRELFAQFRPVIVKRMFSGAGIFADGLMFGLIVDGAIHLKVDETNIADFEREGSRPFTYMRGKSSGQPTRHTGRAFASAERKICATGANQAKGLAEKPEDSIERNEIHHAREN